jgi:MFS family permease
LPGAFDAVWVTSFVFALLGLASLFLFVQNPVGAAISLRSFSSHEMWKLLKAPQFRSIVGAGILLSVASIEDGFLYLLLQQRGNVSTGFFPLFYVGTMCFYMLLAVPVGRVADRWGRIPVFLSGYGAIGLIYFLLSSQNGAWIPWACLFFFGLYYAATEGVLMAMASAVVPGELRTSGLAVLGTMMGLGKMTASLIFGWLWQFHSAQTTVTAFGAALVPILIVVVAWMYTTMYEQFAP